MDRIGREFALDSGCEGRFDPSPTQTEIQSQNEDWWGLDKNIVISKS